jgi:hypothetical protein
MLSGLSHQVEGEDAMLDGATNVKGSYANIRENHLTRIRVEGFEARKLTVESEELCEGRIHRLVRGLWEYEQCGATATIAINFEAPDNPDGTRVSFCRSCVEKLIRDLHQIIG